MVNAPLLWNANLSGTNSLGRRQLPPPGADFHFLLDNLNNYAIICAWKISLVNFARTLE